MSQLVDDIVEILKREPCDECPYSSNCDINEIRKDFLAVPVLINHPGTWRLLEEFQLLEKLKALHAI
jgi:hypothetical protein